ncbi:amidohydrolase [Acidobacteria bacterium Mor1]|nr:amidohydrolase [Acidobacteria bacterium Mor1]
MRRTIGCFWGCALLLLFAALPLQAADLAVKGGVVYTVSGEPIKDGVVLIENGKIKKVGPASRVRIPSGVPVHEAAAVTPGLVDVHTVMGFAGIYNSDRGQVQDQDQLEKSSPVQPELRAVDAYDPIEPLVEFARSLGVTTIHTGHGTGAVISGQTLIAKTRGGTVEDVVLREQASVAATLGPSVSHNFDSPGTRAKVVSMLRESLVAADTYRARMKGDKQPDRNLAHETMAKVLDGDLPLMITAQSAGEIASALRLQKEFGFKLWLDGAAESYRMVDEIRDAGIGVMLHPTMIRSGGDMENAGFDTAVKLAQAGIPFAIQSGFESYVPKTRIILYEAQAAVHVGLAPEQALRAITLTPAEMLGIADRVGSIEAGKDADLVLFDGDPLEYTTHACKVLIEGELVSEECR